MRIPWYLVLYMQFSRRLIATGQHIITEGEIGSSMYVAGMRLTSAVTFESERVCTVLYNLQLYYSFS